MTRSNAPARWLRPLAASLAAGALYVSAVLPTAAADVAVQLPGDPAAGLLGSVERSMFDLTNADRAANGLPPLEFDAETLAIARARAASQLGTPALSHYDANGNLAFVGLLSSSNINYELAGENLARADAQDDAVAARVESALMTSPTHRKNILEGTFRRIAIGTATDASGQLTLAEVYRD
ncbi:MAG: hypothetical protein NVSMB2_04100 [Chloroflexota bacterium]